MRVLLSAYACEPNKGSEQEVGWQRSLHTLYFADEVWVITRANNQSVIEADERSRDSRLHFIYYDLPDWTKKLKKRSWFLYLYFMLWQWGAYKAAAEQHKRTPFDRVYHVTFVSMVAPSLMGRLGIPFVIGPIAGGERAPFRLRRGMPLRGQLSELIRDLLIVSQRINPLTRAAFARAERIFVTSSDSLILVPRKWRHKTQVLLGIAIDEPAPVGKTAQSLPAARFLYVGRLLHWKGIHLAIRALALVRESMPAATLTIIGSGPYELWLRKVARTYGVGRAVKFLGDMPRQKVLDSLDKYTALVFPSLHDSGGFAVLEALSAGVPVICLALGGPGVMVDSSNGLAIEIHGKNVDQISKEIAEGMVGLNQSKASNREIGFQKATDHLASFSWLALCETVQLRNGD